MFFGTRRAGSSECGNRVTQPRAYFGCVNDDDSTSNESLIDQPKSPIPELSKAFGFEVPSHTPARFTAISMPTMKAWQASAYGAEGNPADTIANLKLADVEIPSAGAGQIQVKVKLAAVNPIDWKLFSGGLHGICPCTFPYVPGFDIMGEVTAVGEGAYLRQRARRASGQSCRSQNDHKTTRRDMGFRP